MRNKINYIISGLLFGLALGLIPPFPYLHGEVIWFSASILYFLVFLLAAEQFKRFWLHFGYTTFVSMLIPMIWFYYLTMRYGFWYPPDYLPIIQHFYQVDGEASYDAHVSNLFFVVWPITTIVLAGSHLTSQCFGPRSAAKN